MKQDSFRNPEAVFRAAPFWSWNDDLQNDELERQAVDMKERGWGGYFMHSRVGLITPYLGEEWMDRIRHTVEVSEREGLCAYLYDEDKWPSGYAGGIVPRMDKQFRNTVLQRTATPPPEQTNDVLAIFAKRGGSWVKVDTPTDGEETAYISRYIEPMGNPWFNGTTYVDLMNPDAVKAFIDVTLEPYADLVGEHFGKTIPGCFTDEPSYMSWIGDIASEQTVTWTARFPEEFRKRWGYDILDEAMSIFEQAGDYTKVRWHFWRTALELYVAAYSEPYGRWCREHNLQMTGHYMLEDNFHGQIHWIGAAMPHYEHMGWPGMDHLSMNIDNVMTAKQVTSVCHQLGKKRALSELYGCSGQDFSFKERKWIADWHMVHGINLLNPHLSLYTMRGERKRDFPPTISYQQPWWKFNNLIADYKARVAWALTRGKRVTKVLVVHTIESGWATYTPNEGGPANQYSDWFDGVSKWLLENHYDFDYGDESIMANHGSVVDDRFCVGECAYDLVIIPPAETLRSSTIELLSQWMDTDGDVIAVKPIPRRIDADAANDPWELLRNAIVVEYDHEDFSSALEGLLEPTVQILSPEGNPVRSVWYHHRKDDDHEIYFFANTDLEHGHNCRIIIEGTGTVEVWDALSGDVTQIPEEVIDDGILEVDVFIEAAGSLLLVHDPSRPSKSLADTHIHEEEEVEEIEIVLSDLWNIERKDPNAITLDMATLSLGKGDPSPLQSAIQTANAVRAHEGSFILEYPFTIDSMPKGPVSLVLETPEAFEIFVNGKSVSQDDGGMWLDTTFRKRDIISQITEGANTVTIKGVATADIEIESMYVIGDFAVTTEDLRTFAIEADELDRTPGGDLVEQGYPFFAGTLSMTQTFEWSGDQPEMAMLSLDGVGAIVADVWVNGENAGQVIWDPWEIDVARFLKDGENEIRIDLVNSLRNLLGPHHHRMGELKSVGPGTFRDEGNWTDIYQFVPFGIGEATITAME